MSIYYGFTLSTVTDANAVTGSPLWRFFLATLDGEGVTDLSKIASDRVVTPILNAPLMMEGRVPSDNPQVWIQDADDNDPYVAEGTRLMWGFRRESNTAPYYVPRAATLVQLVGDEAQQDDARTHFVGYDPWKYLFARPAVDFNYELPGPKGIRFPSTRGIGITADEIAVELLANTIEDPRGGHTYIDPGAGNGGTGFWAGEYETTAPVYTEESPYVVQQGKSVGQVWQDLCASNEMDIILTPIYDPFNRPNYLCDLSIFTQAGVTRDEQVFAWNLPSRSLVGLSRIEDGSSRANRIKFFSSQGGSAPGGQTIPVESDLDSVAKYGNYWAQQFFPGQTRPAAIEYMAQEQLRLRSTGRETVTFTPAPERSPRPFQDYGLGDRVPVWASKEGFRKLLGQQGSGTMVETQYQRIYGFPISISDDALETVTGMLTSPQGFSA